MFKKVRIIVIVTITIKQIKNVSHQYCEKKKVVVRVIPVPITVLTFKWPVIYRGNTR